MLLRPKQTKYRKSQKNIRAILPIAPKHVPTPTPKFGSYGIYALESVRLDAHQIEATRMAIIRAIGRKDSKLWIRVFPHIPVTKKPLEVRMGKGKGGVDHFIANVKAGKLLFEYNCPSVNLAKLGFRAAGFKLPIRVGYAQQQNQAQKTQSNS